MKVKFKKNIRDTRLSPVRDVERIKRFTELEYEITSCALCTHVSLRRHVLKGNDLYIERRSRKLYTRHFTPHIIFVKNFILSLSLSLSFCYIALLHLILFIPFFLSFSFALKI